jgi:hypothetical protein
MFVRTIAKTVAGKTYKYSYLVENRRVGGQTRQRLVLNLGAAESVSEKRIDAVIAALRPLSSSPEQKPVCIVELVRNRTARLLGPVLVAGSLWEKLGIGAVIGRALKSRKIALDVVLLSFAMVANRLCDPKSKLAMTSWYPGVHLPRLLEISPDVHQFYRAMDALLSCKDSVERHTVGQLRDLFNQDFCLVFYDLTSTYFEGRSCPLAAYGYSRDHRNDKLQIALGLVVTGDGLPVASDVFVGNTCDATTVKDRVADLKDRFGISRTIFVGDRGMLSASNVATLASEGYQSGQRQRRIERTLPRLVSLQNSVRAGRTTKQCAHSVLADIFSDRRSRRYFRYELADAEFSFELKAEAIADDSSCDGRFILVTDAADLSTQQVISSYKDLKHVEAAFDELKNFIEIRPVYHYNQERVRAHVFICVLSYLLERVLELTLRDAGIEMTARRALQELESVQMVESQIDGHLLHGPTEGSQTARTILDALGVTIPKATLTAPTAIADPKPVAKPCGAEKTLF